MSATTLESCLSPHFSTTTQILLSVTSLPQQTIFNHGTTYILNPCTCIMGYTIHVTFIPRERDQAQIKLL